MSMFGGAHGRDENQKPDAVDEITRLRRDAERYRKVRAWCLEHHVELWPSWGTPYKSFEEAVDALEPEADTAHLSCPECAKCKRHAYSDATTPGFFYDRCEKHRRPERDA